LWSLIVGNAETIQKRAPESWLKLVVQLLSHYPNGGRRLCHNCDTKPVFVAKTGFIDKLSMWILQNSLKVKDCRANPAYTLARQFLNVFDCFLTT
jgi:hypothetical protein